MPENPQWRLEEYTDDTDPFVTPQYYVLEGNLIIAQCEIQAHAARIIEEHERLQRYEQALEQISVMTAETLDLSAAVAEAQKALGPRGG